MLNGFSDIKERFINRIALRNYHPVMRAPTGSVSKGAQPVHHFHLHEKEAYPPTQFGYSLYPNLKVPRGKIDTNGGYT